MNYTDNKLKVGQEVFIMGGPSISYKVTEIFDSAVMTTFGNLRIHKDSIIRTDVKEDMNKICVIK